MSSSIDFEINLFKILIAILVKMLFAQLLIEYIITIMKINITLLTN